MRPPLAAQKRNAARGKPQLVILTAQHFLEVQSLSLPPQWHRRQGHHFTLHRSPWRTSLQPLPVICRGSRGDPVVIGELGQTGFTLVILCPELQLLAD